MCDKLAFGTRVKEPAKCPGIDKLVYGCDDKTYQNQCVAAKNGVVVASRGACLTPGP